MAPPEHMLAIDYGDVRVGIAVAHKVARLPRPLTTLQNNESLIADIQKLIDQEGVYLVLVGLPRGMDGGYTNQTRDAEAFAAKLKDTVTVPIELADETLTSVDAVQLMASRSHEKAEVDALAASLILERYLAEHPAREVRT